MNAENVVQSVLEAEYGGHHDPVARRIAQALTDAALLARPLPTRDEIAMTIAGTLAGIIAGRLYTLNAPSNLGELSFAAVADAVLALLKRQTDD